MTTCTDITLVIVPTYNERDNVLPLISAIFTVLPAAHVLLVDDSSPDGTADLAEEHFSNHPGFCLLRRTGARGLGRSYVDGYQYAVAQGYGSVIQMDADFSHDPVYLPALVEAAETADVVIGSRYCKGGGVRNWPISRWILSQFANGYIRTIMGLPVHDATSGYRCYSLRALQRLVLSSIVSEGYSFTVEMTWRARQAQLRMVETPIIFTDRRHGQSKMSSHVILESMILPWRMRLSRPVVPYRTLRERLHL